MYSQVQIKQMKVFAVIGGVNYENEMFDSLKLFAKKEDAEKYVKELETKNWVDYVEIEERIIN